jgi:MFS family permease
LSLVAVPWLLLDRGAGTGLAGLAYALTLLPYVAFGLIAGAMGDRTGRRRLMYRSHALQALAAAVIPVWAVFESPPIPIIFACVLVVGSARVFADSAAFGALEAIVGAEHFSRGQSILGAAWGIGFFVGPAVAGALIPLIGPASTLAVEAGALALAALAVRAIHVAFNVPHTDGPLASLRASIVEGLHAIWREPTVRAYTGIATVWMGATAGAQALLVPLLRRSVDLSAPVAGTVFALGALMALLAVPVLAFFQRRTKPRWITVGGMLTCVAAIMIVATARSAAHALFGVIPLELGGAVLVAVFVGERQRRVASSMQARVGISGRTLVLAAASIGALVASAAAPAAGLRATYVAMGAIAALVTVGAAALLARLDSVEPKKKRPTGEPLARR